jgi:DNA-binding transcriptional MerR regulator
MSMLINEIARIAGMSKDGIRHYEEMGLITSSARQAGSRIYRDYDVAVLETIEQVRQAQRLGFSLKEIGPLLKAHGSGGITLEETVSFLEDRLTVIHEKQTELCEVEDFISKKLERYRRMVEQQRPDNAPREVGQIVTAHPKP